MWNTDTFIFPKVEFPVLNTQGSNYAGWLESLQASTRAKAHEHYQYSRFIEKPYLTEATAGFKTLESARKDKHDAFSSRTASAGPSRCATRSGQSGQEPEQQSQAEEQDAQEDTPKEKVTPSDEDIFNYQQTKNKVIHLLTIHIHVQLRSLIKNKKP